MNGTFEGNIRVIKGSTRIYELPEDAHVSKNSKPKDRGLGQASNRKSHPQPLKPSFRV